MAEKVAIFVADGTEPAEAIVPADILSRGGVEVDLVGIMPDALVRFGQGICIQADVSIADFKADDYAMLVIPGGSEGVERLGGCKKMIDAVSRFIDSSERYVGSICAGPTILASNGLLEGRKATCYPGCESGFPAGTYQNSDVVVDGNLITATGPGTAYAFGLALLAALKGEAAAKEVASGMLIK